MKNSIKREQSKLVCSAERENFRLKGKKILMTQTTGRWVLTIVLCCVMTTAVLTACSDKDDNPAIPSADVNKGIVINLGSIVIKPYMLFGASLAEVEAYMQENYADWTYTTDDQREGPTFTTRYRKDNKVMVFAFNNTPVGSLRLSEYVPLRRQFHRSAVRPLGRG